MNQGKYKRLIMFISSLLITSILFIIATTPIADGYEISIYRVFPWYFWLLVIISYLWSISVGFKEVLKKENTKGYRLYIPILTMAFTTSLLILMPLIRGYPTFGRGDVMSHIGYIKDILITGSFGDNWYPVLHILGASVSEITGISPKIIPMIFPPIFLLIYLIGVFYLGRELFNKHISLIILTISLIPFLGSAFISFVPSQFAFVFLPFFLYLILKSMKGLRYLYLCSLTIFPFIVTHPHRSLFFVLILFLTLSVIYLNSDSDFGRQYDLKQGINIGLISSFIWSVWYLIYYRAETTVLIFRTFLVGFYTASQEEVAQTATIYSPPLIYYIRVGTSRYGIVGILSLLALIFILFFTLYNLGNLSSKVFQQTLDQIKSKKLLESYRESTIVLISQFMFFTILSTAFFFLGAPGGYGRLLVYVKLFSTFLVALLYFVLFKANTQTLKNYRSKEVISIFLVLLVILSVFTLYNSPWQPNQNSQVTEMEFSGMEWTFEKRNASLSIEELVGLSQRRFHRAIYSHSAEETNIRKGRDTQLSPHFGYEENETLGSQYEVDNYLVISEINRIRYKELYPGWEEAQFFTNEDFEKLESDETVHRIYDNGEFNTYYISS